jgi:hypothetical protein
MYWASFFIQTFFSALIAGVSFFRFSERDTPVKLIGLMYLISCVLNCAQFLTYILGIPGINQVSTAYMFITIIIGTIWYDLVLAHRFRKVFVIISTLVFSWGIIVILFIQNTGGNTSFLSLGISFMWLLYAILYFYRLMQELPTIHLHRLPNFWFNSSFLIYGSGTMFLFASYDYLLRVISSINFWIFHNSVFILGQLIILVGLYYDLRKINHSQAQGTAR